MSEAAMRVLRACREMLARSNTTEHASPLLFRACMCTHGWLAACSGLPGAAQQRAQRSGSGAVERPDDRDSALTGGPLVPLSAVLVLLCVGVVVLVYAYRQSRRRRSGGAAEERESEDAEVMRTCRAPPVVSGGPPRGPLPSAVRPHHRCYDPPPAYLSVIAEEPPSYEMACSDDKLDRSGLTDGVS